MIFQLTRARRGWQVLALGAVTVAMVGLGTHAAPVSAQAAPTLWGIDACDSAQTAVPATQSALGNPQFMARYLGSNRCETSGLSPSEVQYLSSEGIYIMLIADPSGDSFGNGAADAGTAIQQAQSLGAPPGTAIFRDVENSDPITAAYIESWYQAFTQSSSGYVPGFYENPNPGSGSFPSAYCSAESSMPGMSTGAVLWSDEPEPNYGYGASPTQASAPAWAPTVIAGCANTTVAWQYLEDGGFPPAYQSVPVDVDEFNPAYESLLWNGPKGPGAYTALQPYRICDTRSAATTGYSTECSGHPIPAGGTLDAQITGVSGYAGQSVPADAQSVVLNVTAIGSSATTYLTVFPVGSLVPNASNLNVTPGVNQANLAVVALGTGGQVGIYNSAGTINVAVDVEGYFAAPSVSSSVPGLFHPIAPLRICDTRSVAVTGYSTECSGGSLGQGQWQKVVVSGCPTGAPSCTASVPTSDAASVALNLTAVMGTASTFLSVVPPSTSDQCPTSAPGYSNLNVPAKDDLPNRVIVPLGPDQDVCVFNSAGTINFVLDINGWFGNGSESSPGASFYAVTPLRICDTRSPVYTGYLTECSGDTPDPGGILTIPVAGVDGLPAAGGSTPPVAIIANVTAVSGTASTYFTLYPAGVTRPNASDLNVNAGQTTANLAIVPLATTGSQAGDIYLYNGQGNINAIVDVAGWFQ